MRHLFYLSALTVLVTAVSLLTGCGAPKDTGSIDGMDAGESATIVAKKYAVAPDPEHITDGTFDAYIQNFENDAYQRTGRRPNTSMLRVVFGDTSARGQRVIGYCQFLNNGENLVVVNESWWNLASDTKREAMLFHELGHCVLYRAHKIQFRPSDLIPASVMYSFLLPENAYRQNYAYYLDELFRESAPSLNRTQSYSEEDGGIGWGLKDHECAITLDGSEAGEYLSTPHHH